MSHEINVIQKTQIITVEPSSSAVAIINAGPQGPAGPASIPAGGTTGQVLAKLSNDDYDIGWVTP